MTPSKPDYCLGCPSERRNVRSERVIKLSSVSPQLAEMRDSAVPMPAMAGMIGPLGPIQSQHSGAPQITGGAPTIAALGSQIELLHTRTRPKKISLLASDGRRCTFLLKVNHLMLRVKATCFRAQAFPPLLVSISHQ